MFFPHQLRTFILIALASTAFGGFVGTYVSAPYAYRPVPVTYSKVYTTGHVVAPAVTTVHHTPVVSKVSSVHSYHTQHPVPVPVAKYSTYTSPVVTSVHTVPAVATGYAHVPVYGYGYGLSPYGLNYGYGLGYVPLLKKKCEYFLGAIFRKISVVIISASFEVRSDC